MIPVNEPLLNGNEKKYLTECIETGWISSEGPFVKRLEEGFASRLGRHHGIAVCNGSAALDLAVGTLGLGLGDEVLTPAFTIISCAAAIVRSGAKPILVDADPITFNMDPVQLKNTIERRMQEPNPEKLKAILVAHTYGLPTDMDPVLELAKKYSLKIIEDAAEMHGQTYREIPCGAFGEVSTFSFYPNKHITTGEGGMVFVDEAALAERARSLRNLCFDKERRYIHEELGWNFRMSNLQAAVGVAQLERLDEFIARKRAMGALFSELLSGVPGISLPISKTDYAENIYWVYGIVLDKDHTLDAVKAISMLKGKGIQARHFFWPMHRQPVFKKVHLFEGEKYPVAEYLADKGFYLPSGVALTEVQIKETVKALKEILS